ncbi:MAG: LysR family transcriptional regulator [Hyphomicrobium sp.]|nr:LysR family transcriptional regulator [Hyphomicrobium sp.]
MDFKHVRYFVTLAEELNFTRAAERLGISQPALTKAIQTFEGNIGGQLLLRDGKDTRLTELGRTLRTECEKIVANLEKAQLVAKMITSGQSLAVNFGISNTLGRTPIVDFLKAVANEFGSTRLLLHEAMTMDLPSLVLSGSLDCCICSDCEISSPKLNVITLFEERLLLACARSSPLASLDEIPAERLRSEPYLDRLNCEFRLRAAELLRDRGIFMIPRIQSDREEWIQHLLAMDLGVALMPEHSVNRDDIVLRPVRDLHLSRKVQFITVSGPPTTEAVHTVKRLATNFSWPRSG